MNRIELPVESLDDHDGPWAETPHRETRPSQRPTEPAPPSNVALEDAIASGWWYDIG